MAVTPKDILTIVSAGDETATFAAAAVLCKRWGARVANLQLVQTPDAIVAAQDFAASAWAEMWRATRARADAEAANIAARLAEFPEPVDARRAEAMIGPLAHCAARAAMHADLTILQRGEDMLSQAVFEAVLFNSGRPLLLMPKDWVGGALGAKVMVAWRPTREAARALGDAAAFVEAAEKVTIVAVDPQPVFAGDGDQGFDIKAHLVRHNGRVELRQPERMGRSVEAVLLDEAKAEGADMIVMGGYGHTRMRELVLSGVTRALVRTSPVPILISH